MGIQNYVFFASCLFWQGVDFWICFLLTLLVIVFHYPFFLNTESDYDFYLDLHFCKGSKLLIVFNH